MVTHLEKVSTLVLIGCIEKYLFRIWYDTYEGTAIFHTFLDFTYRTEEKFLGGKDVVKRKVETHDIKLSVWTLVNVTLVEVDTHVHVLGSRPRLFKCLRDWVTHIYVRPTVVPFLKVTSEATPDIENVIPLLCLGLYQLSLGVVVVLSNLFHT